jgi:radical SAM protein with 4Fe4S-binding SPASM domain
MQTIDYSTYSRSFHEKVIAARIPLTGAIEVTRRCPFDCLHCYNSLRMNDARARRAELQYEEHCRLLDEIAEAGCLWLLFTGGEIFARPDFLDIYTCAKRKGLIITLFTNGAMITPQIADYLVEWRPFSIEVTLYGVTKETFESVTRTPGSYDECMRGIDLLIERKLPLSLKSVTLRTNCHEIWEMKRFAEKLGVEFKFDSMMNPRIDCGRGPLEVRLEPEEVVRLDMLDPLRVVSWLKFAARFSGPVHRPEDADEIYHCGAGVVSFSIDPEGRMGLCLLSHQNTYDLRRGSFKEGWAALERERRRKMTRMTKCVSCEIKAMCGMCPANAELEERDPESPVDFLCRVSHLRAFALGIEVPPHGLCEYCAGGAGHEMLTHSLASLRQGGALPPAVREPDGGSLPGSCMAEESVGGCRSIRPDGSATTAADQGR